MGKVYLKCVYERQPEDSAPEWQCPSCEAVYSKIEQAVKRGVDVSKQGLTPKQELSEKFSNMALVTTPSIPNRKVEEVVSIVSGDNTYAFSCRV
jgi:hypothetical protein|tara:strand:+ start:342 stop:623 length:282 start_codon:yes stop_codon:yes gene_type:complete